MTIGVRVQQFRRAKGWSQKQLAEQLGVSRQSVSKWELDEAQPEIDKIVLLSELFGVSTDTLLKGETQEKEKPSDFRLESGGMSMQIDEDGKMTMHVDGMPSVTTLNGCMEKIFQDTLNIQNPQDFTPGEGVELEEGAEVLSHQIGMTGDITTTVITYRLKDITYIRTIVKRGELLITDNVIPAP